ncbi:excisionase family DNA-binding protein [Paradevosia shaoguanensis]|uniref:excisionase family DNA-binding protein n=1 Tax=Paradevosia shaoguanensis TaxID=1335043 RepID=UPI0035E3DB7D
MDLPPPPFTVEALAERWECSGQHIRDLVAQGKIGAFRVGRLIRIPVAEVIAFEARIGHPRADDRGATDLAARAAIARMAARQTAEMLRDLGKKKKPPAT